MPPGNSFILRWPRRISRPRQARTARMSSMAQAAKPRSSTSDARADGRGGDGGDEDAAFGDVVGEAGVDRVFALVVDLGAHHPLGQAAQLASAAAVVVVGGRDVEEVVEVEPALAVDVEHGRG